MRYMFKTPVVTSQWRPAKPDQLRKRSAGVGSQPRLRGAGQVQQFKVVPCGTNFILPSTNSNPALGRAPSSVAVGDVDRNGDLDLA